MGKARSETALKTSMTSIGNLSVRKLMVRYFD